MAVDVRGFNLNPNVGGNLAQGLNVLGGAQRIGQISQEQANQEQLKALLGQGDIEGARRVDPQAVQKFEQNQNTLVKQQFDQATREDQQDLSNHVNRVAQLKAMQPEQRISFLQNEIAQGEEAGRDLTETKAVLDTLTNQPELADEVINKGIELGQITGTLKELKADSGGIGGGVSEVQSSKILAGGLVQLVRKDGTVEVVPANEADQTLVRESEERGAELQGLRAGEREGAKGGQKIAIDSFKRVGKIRSNISNLKEGIRLVNEEGAETGPIAKRLPSFRAGTVKLQQVRNQLGLDVVGSVTFGALSEGELKVAFDTALPDGLNEKEIVKWMEERVNAQEKVANNLEEAAIFLSKPGRTVGDLVERNKQRKEIKEAAEQQSQLPQGVTEEDITETMRANNMTREQVLQRLNNGGS